MESKTFSIYKKLAGANKASQLAGWLKSIDFDALMLGPTLVRNGYLRYFEDLSDEEAKIRFTPEESIFKPTSC